MIAKAFERQVLSEVSMAVAAKKLIGEPGKYQGFFCYLDAEGYVTFQMITRPEPAVKGQDTVTIGTIVEDGFMGDQ